MLIRIRIVCVGKMKEKYLLDAQAEFIKRLSRFSKTEVVEVIDEPTFENLTESELNAILEKEGARIKKAMQGFSRIIALAIEGEECSSQKFASRIEQIMHSGSPDICFLIGGSLGILDSIKKNVNLLSLSKMTFPHRIARIVLLEQIFRAFKIINNETYHK